MSKSKQLLKLLESICPLLEAISKFLDDGGKPAYEYQRGRTQAYMVNNGGGNAYIYIRKDNPNPIKFNGTLAQCLSKFNRAFGLPLDSSDSEWKKFLATFPADSVKTPEINP